MLQKSSGKNYRNRLYKTLFIQTFSLYNYDTFQRRDFLWNFVKLLKICFTKYKSKEICTKVRRNFGCLICSLLNNLPSYGGCNLGLKNKHMFLLVQFAHLLKSKPYTIQWSTKMSKKLALQCVHRASVWYPSPVSRLNGPKRTDGQLKLICGQPGGCASDH